MDGSAMDHGGLMDQSQPAYDADIEAGLDTDGEMAVGEALRWRQQRKGKGSIGRHKGKSNGGALGMGMANGKRRTSADDTFVVNGQSGDTRGKHGKESQKPWRRRQRRHSTPGFSLSDGDTDSEKLVRLNRRLDAMRRLPRSSRYATSQIQIIHKALDILRKSESEGRSAPEDDALAKLLAAVSL